MKNKSIKNKTMYFGLFSAMLVFLSGIVVFLLRNRLFGDYTFMHADLAAQYSSIAKLFLRQLFVNHNIIYSWSVSMGSDTLPLYAFYSCFSPFTLIYALNFNIDVLSFLVTFGKLALAAYTFNYFVRKYIKVDSSLSIMLAVSYALGGFSMAYYANMIWFDGLYMLPVIIGLVFDLSNGKKKYYLLVLAYVYIFVVNFYSGYIIGIFSAVAFLMFLIRDNSSVKDKIKRFVIFIIVAFSAALISAPVLYPTAKAFLGSRVEDSSAFMGLHLNVMDIYNQLFIGQTSGREMGRFPYIYCGLLSVLLITFFFLNKNINKKDKILAAVTLGLYILASLIPIVYIFLHCFDTPDSYNFRYSYLIEFLLLCFAAFGLREIQGINKKIILAVGSLCALVYVMYSFIQVRIYDYIEKIDLKYVIINIVFLLVYAYLIYVWIKKDKKATFERLIIGLVVVELCINTLAYESINGKVKSEETEVYFFYNNQIQQAVKSLAKEDDSWYRIYSPNSLYCNDSMKYGYKSVGIFSSYQNQNLRKTLGKLGYVSSALTHRDMGSTEITRMLMGEKYNILSSSWNNILDKAYYEEFDYYLPVGYMVSDEIVELSLSDEENPFANQNNILSAMIGEDVEYFYNVGKDVEIDYYNAYNDETGDYPTFRLEDNNEQGYVLFYNNKERIEYAYFSMPYVMERTDSPVVVNSNMEVGPLIMDSFLFSPHIVETAECDSDIYIVMGGERLPWALVDQSYFYGTNKELLPYIYKKLNNNGFSVEEYRDGYIRGKINVEECNVIFTSIPYEDGWRIYVDGVKVDNLSLLDGAFLGAKLDSGEHDVVFAYYDNNITIGLMLFVFGLILVYVLQLAGRLKFEK